MTRTDLIAAITEIVHSSDCTEDEARQEAEAYVDAGFTVSDVWAWEETGCFRANAAIEMRDAGIVPEQARTKTGEDVGVGSYSGTIGYKVANDDLTIEAALGLLSEA